jgi:hypothetical protein
VACKGINKGADETKEFDTFDKRIGQVKDSKGAD